MRQVEGEIAYGQEQDGAPVETQLVLYAQDLNRLAERERTKEDALHASYQQSQRYAYDLRVAFEAERGRRQELAEVNAILQAEIAEHQQTEAALQTLSQRLLKVLEDERRHIARELHDELGQALTVIKINLRTAQERPNASVRKVADSLGIVERTLQQVRSLLLELRPPLLDELGLVPALDRYVKQQAQRVGLRIRFVDETGEMRPSCDVETACFRVVQEALTNATRHAQAQYVDIALRYDGPALQLCIQDDGRGFHVAAAKSRAAQGTSMGIMGMHERVQLAGGQLSIESTLGRGTVIQARFPLTQPDD